MSKYPNKTDIRLYQLFRKLSHTDLSVEEIRERFHSREVKTNTILSSLHRLVEKGEIIKSGERYKLNIIFSFNEHKGRHFR